MLEILSFAPYSILCDREILKKERKVTSAHVDEFLNVADVGRSFPTAAMVRKAEGPKIAGFGFAAESGMKPRVVGFAAEDGQGLAPLLDAKVAEASMSVQRTLKIFDSRLDVHNEQTLRKGSFTQRWKLIVAGTP